MPHPMSARPSMESAATKEGVATVFVSLELSQSTWLVTSLAPGSATMSKHSVTAGDSAELLARLARLATKARSASKVPIKICVIQEAGLDGFWVHRLLEANGIESHIVDAASIAVPRRRRRAKTDTIDGETLLRTLLAWKRGEPRVCAMVSPAHTGRGRPTSNLTRTRHFAARTSSARQSPKGSAHRSRDHGLPALA